MNCIIFYSLMQIEILLKITQCWYSIRADNALAHSYIVIDSVEFKINCYIDNIFLLLTTKKTSTLSSARIGQYYDSSYIMTCFSETRNTSASLS